MICLKYDIVPVAKPRMTRRDKWAQRPCVARYREYCDEVRRLGIYVKDGDSIQFGIPMPKSWSSKRCGQMSHTAHKARPDLDNLLKALLDAIYQDDSVVSNLEGLSKVWSPSGYIRIMRQA